MTAQKESRTYVLWARLWEH